LCFLSFPRRTAVICKEQIIPAFGNKKRGSASYSKLENETNPLSFFRYSDDFSDGMDDTEQQSSDQGESSDETANDDIECEDSYCARYAITEGDKPEAHPSEAEWEPNAKPHQEVVTYTVCHVDRLEECGKA
jgi:hypothetical protein